MSDHREIEWRVWYQRRGVKAPQMRDGFPYPDLRWGAYFHDIHPTDVLRWESRFQGRGEWKTKEQGGPQPCYEIANQHGQKCLRAKDHHGRHSPYGDIVP